MKLTNTEFMSQVFKEGKTYVAYTPELDLSSCATTQNKAQKNLLEAVRLFLEEAEKKGSLDHKGGRFSENGLMSKTCERGCA